MLKRKDLESVEITDEMLMKLLEYPPEAFEIYFDEGSGREALRVKSSFLRELAKLVRTVVTEVALDVERDFDVYVDPVTGRRLFCVDPESCVVWVQDIFKNFNSCRNSFNLIEERMRREVILFHFGETWLLPSICDYDLDIFWVSGQSVDWQNINYGK